jgi:hypothetical protein
MLRGWARIGERELVDASKLLEGECLMGLVRCVRWVMRMCLISSCL